MANIKKSTMNAEQGVGKKEPSCTVCGIVTWYEHSVHYAEQNGSFLKI